MCGISAVFAPKRDCRNEVSRDDNAYLKRRGPDSFRTHNISVYDDAEIMFSSSVLHMRGKEITFQPAKDENGNILLWNGEIFGGSQMQLDESDTTCLLKQLSQAENNEALIEIVECLQGPWAFIYWQAKRRALWFARDILGRRSLLWGCSTSGHHIFGISSVAIKRNEINCWKEVHAAGIYCLCFDEYTKENIVVNLHPWQNSVSGNTFAFEDVYIFENWKILISPCTVKSPIMNTLNKSEPVENDFFYYSFQQNELGPESQQSKSRTVVEKIPDLNLILQKEVWQKVIKEFYEVLDAAVHCRVQNQLFLCTECYRLSKEQYPDINKISERVCTHATVAVLFSGGLDSMIIAFLADRHLPENAPIDLLNVAFEHEARFDNDNTSRKTLTSKAHANNLHTTVKTYNSPDRISGINAWKELQLLLPRRTWNFVEINVTRKELQEEREKHICNLIYPATTVLDDSIGCACWFGSRGKGHIKSNGTVVSYTSPAKVILIGMGADEQLAGYSRHRNKFNFAGWNGVLKEIEMEINRISSRNLGRDDRVISDHGREVRLPFLDENVISFLNSLPIWLKANLSLPRGIGEKLLLRLLAVHLGLNSVATLPKRAIQFGSRIARSEEKKEKGSDSCIRLKR